VGSSPAGCRSCARSRLFRDLRTNPFSLPLSSLGHGSLGARSPGARGSRSRRGLRNGNRGPACSRATGSRFADFRCGCESQDDRRGAFPRAGCFMASRRRHCVAFRRRKLRCYLLPAGPPIFSRSCGRGAGNATGSRGGWPDRLKHLATAPRKPTLPGSEQRRGASVWTLLDRRFALGNERTICRLLSEHGFTDVSPLVVEKMLLFPDVESFLLLNLWAFVDDLDARREDERTRILTRLREDAAETLGRFGCGAGLRHPMRANVVTARIA
jgi:hypothetical protein